MRKLGYLLLVGVLLGFFLSFHETVFADEADPTISITTSGSISKTAEPGEMVTGEITVSVTTIIFMVTV